MQAQIEEKKDEFIGFNVSIRDKKRLKFMSNELYNMGLISTNTLAETSRWCLSMGWYILRLSVTQVQMRMDPNIVSIDLNDCRFGENASNFDMDNNIRMNKFKSNNNNNNEEREEEEEENEETKEGQKEKKQKTVREQRLDDNKREDDIF